MIHFIQGSIINSSSGLLTIGVGSTGAMIGYAVQVPQTVSYSGLSLGSSVEVWIHTHIREDAFDLFGFFTPSERELFLTLIKCNGIGPKAALGILSHASSDRIISAIVQEDKTFLHSLPGVGKKTAERLVVELGEAIQKKLEAGAFGDLPESSFQLESEKGASISPLQKIPVDVFREAKEALLALGYREQEIRSYLEKVASQESEDLNSVGSVVKAALQQAG